jgi:hypothetical protein
MILLSFAREAKYFLHVVLQEAMATSVFLCHIPNGDDVQEHVYQCEDATT